MKARSLFFFMLLQGTILIGQTGPGIALYPTGTETGLGLRLNRDKRVTADARITRASIFSRPGISSFVTELSVVCRIVYLEKVRLHLGLGGRADWNFSAGHRFGAVVPLGVEAFPFPFQNAGLFFEAAPFYVRSAEAAWQAGIRTVAGFVFYFPGTTAKST